KVAEGRMRGRLSTCALRRCSAHTNAHPHPSAALTPSPAHAGEGCCVVLPHSHTALRLISCFRIFTMVKQRNQHSANQGGRFMYAHDGWSFPDRKARGRHAVRQTHSQSFAQSAALGFHHA